MVELINIKNDEDWVLKVLNSCTNLTHIKSSDNLFKNLINKWSYELSDISIMSLTSNYERKKSLKISEIRTNIGLHTL